MATGMWLTHTKGNMGMQWDQPGHWEGEYRPQPSFAILRRTQPVPPARSHVMDDLALQHVVLLVCCAGSKSCWRVEPTSTAGRNVQLLDQFLCDQGRWKGDRSDQYSICDCSWDRFREDGYGHITGMPRVERTFRGRFCM
jgi:hypothetical protein